MPVFSLTVSKPEQSSTSLNPLPNPLTQSQVLRISLPPSGSSGAYFLFANASVSSYLAVSFWSSLAGCH